MKQDLTSSSIERQNVLNNSQAIKVIQDFIGVSGVIFEDEYRFTTKQVADLLNISTPTIRRYLDKNGDELKRNGYEVVTGERLTVLKKALGSIIDDTTKTTSLGIFNFKSFLNLAMLLQESQRAQEIRKIILDIVIDLINKKTGGNTKYINFSDDNLPASLFINENHRKEFTDALKNFVEMGNAKYAIYTNKIYQTIFKEKAQEYRSILNLSSKENVRDTMYSEIIDLITAFEIGIADEIKAFYLQNSRKITPYELDAIIAKFANQNLWGPLLRSARTKMASRDSHFRDVQHSKLQEYIGPVSQEDFNKFLNEKQKLIAEIAVDNKEVFKRLRNK